MSSGPDATSGSERSWIARRWMVHKSISLYRFWSFIDALLIDYLQVHNGMNRDNKHLCETEISDKEELPSSNHEKATCYNLKLVSQSAKMVFVLSRVGHQHLNSNNGWFILCFTAFLIFYFFSVRLDTLQKHIALTYNSGMV